MPDPEEISSGSAADPKDAVSVPPAAADEAPVVLVPVSAEDFERRKRRIIWTCVIAAALTIAAAVYIYKLKVDPIRARESYDAAERLYRIARFEQAILEFNHAVTLDPTLAEAYLYTGKSRMGLTRAQEAIPDFTKYIELRPSDPAGYMERAQAYLDLEKFDLAAQDATRAIEVDAKLGAAYNLRGVAYRNLKEMTKAIADMDRAIELEPTMNHHFERASTLQAIGQHELALEDLNKVVDFAPLNAQAYHARARSFRALGNIESADRDHAYGRYLDSR